MGLYDSWDKSFAFQIDNLCPISCQFYDFIIRSNGNN